MERPSTKEREAATLYLTDLNGMKKNGDENSDLLRFYAKVKTSRSKTRSAYTLMDPGASHCYIDSTYAKQLGLPLRHAGRMSVITAGTKHPRDTRSGWKEIFVVLQETTPPSQDGTHFSISKVLTTLLWERTGTRRHAIWWIQVTCSTCWTRSVRPMGAWHSYPSWH
jgi:hypothetical protein